MKLFDAFADWFCIIMSPITAIVVWSTQDMAFLRFLAALWLIAVTIEASVDRYNARSGRLAISADNGGESTPQAAQGE